MITRQGRVCVHTAQDSDVGTFTQLPQRQRAGRDGMSAEEYAVQTERWKVHPGMVAVPERRPRLCPQPEPDSGA